MGRVLTRNKQDILKRSQFLDGTVLILYLIHGKYGARHGILPVETAIDT